MLNKFKKILFLVVVVIIITIIFFVFLIIKKEDNKNSSFWNGKYIRLYGSLVEKNKNNFVLNLLEKDEEKLITINFDQKTIIKKESSKIKEKENLIQEIELYKKNLNNKKDLFYPGWNILENIDIKNINIGDEIEILLKDDGKSIAENVLVKHIKENKNLRNIKENNIYKINGEIINFDNTSLEIKNINFIGDENNYKLIVSQNTEIFEKTKKQEEIFNRENNDFINLKEETKRRGGDITKIKAPGWFLYKDKNLQDLKKNLRVEVEYFIQDNEYIAKNIFLLNY